METQEVHRLELDPSELKVTYTALKSFLDDFGHDESESGQQELYVALRGAGSVDIDGTRHPLDADHLVKVDPGTARVLSSGPEGLRVLCVGGVPGGVYEPPGWSSSGE